MRRAILKLRRFPWPRRIRLATSRLLSTPRARGIGMDQGVLSVVKGNLAAQLLELRTCRAGVVLRKIPAIYLNDAAWQAAVPNARSQAAGGDGVHLR